MGDNNEFPKLSRKEFKVLELLIAKGEMFGLEMVEASEDELKRGTVYVTLQRMGDKGYVESREEPPNTRSRHSAPQILGDGFGRKSLSNESESA